MKNRLCYLASPYTHKDTAVMESRRKAACQMAGELIAKGIPVISPIAHNAAIIEVTGGASGWDVWKMQDQALLESCSKLLVLCLDGWEKSKGVQAEIKLAQALGKPIEFIEVKNEEKNKSKQN